MSGGRVSKTLDAKDEIQKTPLHHAAINNHQEIVELLVSNGADIDVKDEHGVTPLHYASRSNHKETSEVLILYGADIGCPKVRLAQRSI